MILVGPYVKLSTAVQPSWSEGGTTRHNFRRRTTQESFQQSLVEISPVVSEEVIEISSKGQNCSILSQNVPKFELYKHDELFNMYYRTFYEL
jgi:hypothetical protein